MSPTLATPVPDPLPPREPAHPADPALRPDNPDGLADFGTPALAGDGLGV